MGAAILSASLTGPAFSQGAPQTVTLMKVDPTTLATGYRTSKVVGSTVVNEANETREKLYRDGGWKQFDENAAPYSTADVARERASYRDRAAP